jgi:hypothetical protein
MSKFLVFSHGFGVEKDSKGLFSEISKAFPEYKPVLFDYNDIAEDKKITKVASYKKQSIVLDRQLQAIVKRDPDANITVIGHSQGCIIIGLTSNLPIARAILLAPPVNVSARKTKIKPDRVINRDGSVTINRKDGTQIILSLGFIAGLKKTNPLNIYKRLASKVPITIVVARQDELLDDSNFSELDSTQVIKIDGDHNFTGKNRKGLIETLSKILN